MRNLMVGDWLGQEADNGYWSNEELQKYYNINKDRLKSAIKTVRRDGWDSAQVKSGCACPTSNLATVNQLKKEIIRRKHYSKYFGVK